MGIVNEGLITIREIAISGIDRSSATSKVAVLDTDVWGFAVNESVVGSIAVSHGAVIWVEIVRASVGGVVVGVDNLAISVFYHETIGMICSSLVSKSLGNA